MVAMNLLRGSGGIAEYVVTGSWGTKAVREAEREGAVRVAWNGAELGFVRVPEADDWTPSPDAAYLHVTTNETIEGVEWSVPPVPPPGVPLVADASSDLLSRPIDVGGFGVLYAGAQKNAGPAGVTIAIMRGDLLDRVPDGLPTMLDYRTFVEHGSLYNTPPVFAIYVVMLVTRWLRDEVGGLEGQERRNRAKAELLYDAIDASEGFYRGHADPGSRSLMNVTFRLPSDQLGARFVSEAARRGLAELRGSPQRRRRPGEHLQRDADRRRRDARDVHGRLRRQGPLVASGLPRSDRPGSPVTPRPVRCRTPCPRDRRACAT